MKTKLDKLAIKIKDYNNLATKYGFSEIKFDPKTTLISPFLPIMTPPKGMWNTLK